MKRLVLITFMICSFTSMVIPQTMMLTPHGLSPRQADADTLDIFDRPYNGLLNVGVETKMYFKGYLKGASLGAPSWTLSAPTGSNAVIGDSAAVDVDTSTQIVPFTPDIEGTYKIAITSGAYSDTVTVNAGKFKGIEDGNCGLCHSEKVTAWEGTGHYEMFETKMTTPGYYKSYCIKCHTTGYDTYANNDGFDDRTQHVSYLDKDTTFVFPDSTALTDYYGSPDSSGNFFPAVWDSLLVFFPNSMKLARIQCESCHGPGSAHSGVTTDSKMVASLSTKNCALCHDSGTHHVFPAQWRVSGHASVPPYPAGSRTTCEGCHNGAQFIQLVEGEEITKQPPVNITCAVCHNPHDATNEHQLRTVEAKLANGVAVTEGGAGKLCMNCHHQRRSDVNAYTDEPHRHYGPHYGPQADMLMATNAISFGKRLPSSPHLSATKDACVDCHMYPGHVDDEGNVILVGSHTFRMTEGDTVDNVAACAGCHGDIGDSFADKPYFFNGNADHDGDGVEEGVQDEVRGLMEELASLLPAATDTNAYDPHDDPDSTWTRTELKAAFNYDYVYYDHSYGIHNPAYTVALLKVSIKALKTNAIEGEIVAIDDVPNDQGKQVKIIWDKFIDDGVAIDPINSYTVKRFDEYDSTWTGVGEYTADGSKRYALVVPTLFDSTIAFGEYLTKFKVVAISRGGNVFESAVAEGHSIDNLIPHAPTNLMTLVVNRNIDISWEAPLDPDINYYRIYRSTEPNFPADETTEIATTIEFVYTDENMDDGTYYYKVSAVDFSGNLGELSAEVSAEILSIDEGLMPIEYALSQNFPNPFNPITTINFSMPENGFVTLTIYNSIGQIVSELIGRDMEAGKHSITFNADNLSSGLYFYAIRINEFTETRKMILLK